MIKYPLNVTIDSNVFDANKYDLAEDSTLSHLISYVEKQKIKVIMSNIVVNEISKHIQDNAYEIAAMVNNLRKDARKMFTENLMKNVGMEYVLTKADRNEMARKAKEGLTGFLDKLDIEILDSSTVDVETIFNDYINFNPPFENNEKKRKEFPDAFIAAQIRERFKNGEKLAIVSADKGIKQACGSSTNYMFFCSLGELYDTLNKEEQAYNESVEYIKNLSSIICERIKDVISDNDCVDVIGVEYDKDGIKDGYDYSETIVEKVSNVSSRIHTIDEISGDQVSATLVCLADVDVDCYYEDYDNAAWDSESKSYFYVETREVKEIHRARFGVRVELDVKSGEFRLSKFTVTLGGDSRKERFEITDAEDYDYEQDIMDMDRESVGLLAMGEYDSFLEEALANSKMKQDFVSKFETINALLSDFEDVSMVYDEIMEQIKGSPDEAKKSLLKIAKNMDGIEDFPLDLDISEIMDGDMSDVHAWVEERYLEVVKFADADRLPDSIDFGDQIIFFDANDSKYTLSLDEIHINPSEGESEYIDIQLSNDLDNDAIKGYIKLTVGYINYDEDGGVADGLEDDVEYYYEEIIKEIDNVINSLRELLDNHIELKKLLEDLL
jgi:hypothetical protein